MDAVTLRERGAALLAPLADPATYRAWLYFLAVPVLGLVAFVWIVVTLAFGVANSFTLVGIPVVAVSVVGARRLGEVARRMAGFGLGTQIASPPALVREPGLLGWLRAVLTDSVGWRAVLYLLVLFPFGLVAAITVLVLTMTAFLAPVLIAAPWVIKLLASVNRWLAERLLAPVTLSERAERLRASRQQVVDGAADERRRIERDLHDGAQARLVALAMDLGMAREKLASGDDRRDREQAATLLASAHDEVKVALRELRELARGIHPAVLTDLGLDPALSAVAARCTVPVTLSVSLPVRPSPAIEQIAYYCVSELLVNVSRHSRATGAVVDVRRDDDLLTIVVRDDGVGGAVPGAGSGLTGLAERAEAVEGRLLIDSPPGGPTLVTVELPCGS